MQDFYHQQYGPTILNVDGSSYEDVEAGQLIRTMSAHL